MIFVLATNNYGKVKEIREILSEFELLERPSELSEIEEYGNTFEQNALIKARAVALYTKLPAIADDSGLEVEALKGQLGVNSSTYGGSDLDNISRCKLLLKNLKNSTNRRAKFVSVACVYFPETMTCLFARGEISGKIAENISGSNGFGYDPIFIPDGFKKTFAEMPKAQKNAISHRALAFKNLKSLLNEDLKKYLSS
jgi:XTP/dITP diphosphohydrolase